MKKIKLSLFIAVIVLLVVSCERDITEPQISPDPTAPTLSDLSYSGDFSMAYADSAITFSWTAASFGFESSTTYSLEVSSTSDFSGDVATLFTTQDMQGTATVNDVNNILLSWDNTIGDPAVLYYRVSASVTDAIVVYSGVKSKEYTPFETLIDYPMAYVPGSYQGWAPGDENGRLFSYEFNSVYEGIIRLVDADNPTVQFKITENPNWDGPNYGGTLTKSEDNYSGVLDPAGDNYEVDAGTYAFTVDLSALTMELTKTDDWGIIGSAVPPYDWSADVNMFYNGQRKMWEITADFEAGEFKFRANDAWDLNYGDTGADGSLEAGGDNMVLAAAGNYTIRFDPVNLTYTVTKN